MVDYTTSNSLKKPLTDSEKVTEIADFTKVPEVNKAIDVVADAATRSLAAAYDRQDHSAPGTSEAKRQEYAAIAAKHPEEFKKILVADYQQNPEQLKLVAMEFILMEMRQKTPIFLEGKYDASSPIPQTLSPAIWEEITKGIRDVEVSNYTDGSDRGAFAKAAVDDPLRFDASLKATLLNNPEAIELIKELPRSLEIAKIAARNVNKR